MEQTLDFGRMRRRQNVNPAKMAHVRQVRQGISKPHWLRRLEAVLRLQAERGAAQAKAKAKIS